MKRTVFLLITILCLGCSHKKATNDQQKDAAVPATKASAKKNILFFGDSLTAGYGLDDPSQAFPGVVENKIDSAKLPYNIVNAGVSGETSAGGKARIGWLLRQKIDVFVLELGANDGLRGIPVTETTQNLQDIVDSVQTKYPSAKLVLAGMMVPPNMGNMYSADFRKLFPALAAKNNMALIPFLLQGVAGVPVLNQHDGIHPTAQGAKIVADNVWKVLKPLL